MADTHSTWVQTTKTAACYYCFIVVSVTSLLFYMIHHMNFFARPLPDDAPYRRGGIFEASGRTGPYNFFSAGHAFTIPIEYLFMVNISTYDPAFIVTMSYPDLRPDKSKQKFATNYDFSDFIDVIVGEQTADSTRVVTDLPERFDKGPKQPIGFGLVQVNSLVRNSEWYYHAAEGKDDAPAMIACRTDVQGHSCNVVMFRDSMEFRITFPFRFLAQWRDVIEKSSNFIISHIVPSSPDDLLGRQMNIRGSRR